MLNSFVPAFCSDTGMSYMWEGNLLKIKQTNSSGFREASFSFGREGEEKINFIAGLDSREIKMPDEMVISVIFYSLALSYMNFMNLPKIQNTHTPTPSVFRALPRIKFAVSYSTEESMRKITQELFLQVKLWPLGSHDGNKVTGLSPSLIFEKIDYDSQQITTKKL